MTALMVAGCAVARPAMSAEDLFDRAPWSGSALLGTFLFEGDEEVKNGLSLGLRAGYTFTPMWELEAGLDLAPVLSARKFNDTRYHLDDDTWGLRLGLDLLFPPAQSGRPADRSVSLRGRRPGDVRRGHGRG
jgi:hypothetical protein